MNASPTRSRKDWLGRRLDLRDCHRDPRCNTHRNPLWPCSCHAFFRDWDWVIDCLVYVALIIAAALTISTMTGVFLGLR
jgi:hypothetical protein